MPGAMEGRGEEGPVPVVLAWSGGKDSAMTLRALRQDPLWEVVELLTTVNAEYDRVVMHGVRRSLLEAQAAAIGLPLRIVELPSNPTNEEYGEKMNQALEAARAVGAGAVAFGDLFLEEVRDYRIRSLAGSGLQPLFPLWGVPTDSLAADFIASGFRAILTCVDTRALDAAFAGRSFDPSLLEDLPAGVDPCGENGEFHTFVHAGPIFREPVPIAIGERILRDARFEYVDLLLGG